MATIDDFKKLEVRIGRIAKVSEIEGAKSPVYRLSVQFGGEIGERTIVAGIRGAYTPEMLMEKKIACILNLEPKSVAGVVSEGMLLAADGENGPVLIVPDGDAEEGSLVR
jgi:tRNA-binding protein